MQVRGREREKKRSECAYAQVHAAVGPNGKTLQVFFIITLWKLVFFYKSYLAVFGVL